MKTRFARFSSSAGAERSSTAMSASVPILEFVLTQKIGLIDEAAASA
jgi:hypothetical protein